MRINPISNNYFSKQVNFKNTNKQDERQANMTRAIYKHRDSLIKSIEADTTDRIYRTSRGDEKPLIRRYDIPDTKNQAIIAVCKTPDSLCRHTLIAGAYSKRADELCSKTVLQNVYKRNITDFFKTPDGIKQVASAIIKCSDEIDKDFAQKQQKS